MTGSNLPPGLGVLVILVGLVLVVGAAASWLTPRSYRCRICSADFATRTARRRHVDHVHHA